MMDKEKLESRYAIYCPKDHLLRILELETGYQNETLDEILRQIDGVKDIEYNGHFGPYIYLTVETDVDNDKTWKQIKTEIRNFIK
jgi:hypothetical protein